MKHRIGRLTKIDCYLTQKKNSMCSFSTNPSPVFGVGRYECFVSYQLRAHCRMIFIQAICCFFTADCYAKRQQLQICKKNPSIQPKQSNNFQFHCCPKFWARTFVIATQSGIFHLKAAKAVVEVVVVVVVVVVPLIAKTKKLQRIFFTRLSSNYSNQSKMHFNNLN